MASPASTPSPMEEELASSVPQDDGFRGPTAGGETKPPRVAVEEHPRRPGEPDCSYYVKFGSCKFGISCVYNHPPRQLGSEAGRGDGKLEQLPRRPGEPDCSYYVKFGTCKFGMNCRFNHPPDRTPQQVNFPGKACNRHHCEGKSKVEQVNLNLLGLPLRPGTGLCTYYMNRGICKFGTNCKFHHPDKGSDQDKCINTCHANQESSQLKIYSVFDHGELNDRPVPSQEIHKPGNSCFQPAEPICYTRDQLLQLCPTVDLPEAILELIPDAIRVRKETNHDVISLILEKVFAEPIFCPIYAQLCSYQSQNLTPFPPEDPGGEEITFKRALESARSVRADIFKLTGPDEEMERRDKLVVDKIVHHIVHSRTFVSFEMKLKTLGNIRFIRELLKEKLVIDKIVHHIVQVVMDCEKFCLEPLEKVDLLNIIFEGMLDSVSAGTESNMGANAMVSGNKCSMASNDAKMIDGKDVDSRNKRTALRKSSNEVLNNSIDPQKNYSDAAFSHLVENEKPTNAETSVRISRGRCSISEIMELVIDAGAEEGSDEHFIATLLFIKPEYREIFLTLNTRQGRIGWLRRMCKVKE